MLCLLVNREPDYKFCWHPGCLASKNKDNSVEYLVGPIGRMGCTGSQGSQGEPKPATVVLPNTKIPSALVFTIGYSPDLTNEQRKDLHTQTLSTLRDFQKETSDPILINEEGLYNRHDQVIKPEYVEAVNDLEESHATKAVQIEQHIDRLKELGCRGLSKLHYNLRIPLEYYNVTTTPDYTHARISVKCYDQTQFYLFLLQQGILERSYPDWYRQGRY